LGARATASQTPSESEKKLRNSSGNEFNCLVQQQQQQQQQYSGKA